MRESVGGRYRIKQSMREGEAGEEEKAICTLWGHSLANTNYIYPPVLEGLHDVLFVHFIC
jgi:hypothetical protein